jgi:hypothetical protein
MNEELQDMLQLLVLLLCPTKNTCLNIGPVASIVDCLFVEERISWVEVFWSVIKKVVG